MPFQWIIHDAVPYTVPLHVRKSDKMISSLSLCTGEHDEMAPLVAFQWRLYDAVPKRVSLHAGKHKVPSRVPFQLRIYDVVLYRFSHYVRKCDSHYGVSM